jgi:hypothetical protein
MMSGERARLKITSRNKYQASFSRRAERRCLGANCHLRELMVHRCQRLRVFGVARSPKAGRVVLGERDLGHQMISSLSNRHSLRACDAKIWSARPSTHEVHISSRWRLRTRKDPRSYRRNEAHPVVPERSAESGGSVVLASSGQVNLHFEEAVTESRSQVPAGGEVRCPPS